MFLVLNIEFLSFISVSNVQVYVMDCIVFNIIMIVVVKIKLQIIVLDLLLNIYCTFLDSQTIDRDDVL